MSAVPHSEILNRISSFPFTETDYSCSSRMVRKLLAVYPARITGTNLARELGLSGFAHAALCFNFLRANEALAPCGLAIRRSGGAPHDTYFIRPI